MSPESYGWSKRDGGVYWFVTPSGLKQCHRGRERFRYMLSNEYGIPPVDASRIVAECERQRTQG